MMIFVSAPQIVDEINNDLLGVGYHDKIPYHDDNIMRVWNNHPRDYI